MDELLEVLARVVIALLEGLVDVVDFDWPLFRRRKSKKTRKKY